MQWGDVIMVDADISGACWGKFLRVKVWIDIIKPLTKGRILTMGDVKYWIPFKYERLPNFCYHCGLFKDKAGRCEKLEKGKLLMDGFNQQYGAWLRASSNNSSISLLWRGWSLVMVVHRRMAGVRLLVSLARRGSKDGKFQHVEGFVAGNQENSMKQGSVQQMEANFGTSFTPFPTRKVDNIQGGVEAESVEVEAFLETAVTNKGNFVEGLRGDGVKSATNFGVSHLPIGQVSSGDQEVSHLQLAKQGLLSTLLGKEELVQVPM